MTNIKKKTSGGGFLPFFLSTLIAFILTVGCGFLESGSFCIIVGIISWIGFYIAIRNGVKNDMEEIFPDSRRDAIASEFFRQGRKKVEIKAHSWSDAEIPLPMSMTTKYKKREDE